MQSAARATWPFAQQPRSMVALRWLTVAIVGPFVIFGGFSSYRAWVQVRSVSLRVTDRELRPGAVVDVEAVSWARTHVTVRVVLIQGARAETLAVHRIPSNHQASLDPRTREARLLVAVSEQQLARFRVGDAVLRATAIGGPQWLRTPPPKVQDVVVTIASPQRSAAPPRY